MTLFRYLFGRVGFAFLAAFVCVVGLIALVDLIELMRRSGGAEGMFGALAYMAVLHAPSISLEALPFVMMLSTMWAYMQLARGSELIAAHAAGLPFWRAAAPGVAAAAVVGVAAVALYAPLSAAALNQFERLEARYLKGRESLLAVSSDGLWLREPGAEGGQVVIHARRTNAEGTELRDVVFLTFGPRDALRQRIDAPRAVLGDGAWSLTDPTIRRIESTARDAGPPQEETRATLALPTRLTAAEIQNSFAPPESISVWRLPHVIQGMEEAGFSARRHKAHFHSMLALPALLAAMALIAAAFAIRPPRFVSYGKVALGCALTGFVFYFMSDVSMALGASGAAPPALGAWAPVAGAACMGLALALYFREG